MHPYELTFDERSGYLYACVTADAIDRETALDYLRKVADRITDSEYERLMLERDIPMMLPAAELFFTTQDFLKMVGPTRVAFVNKHIVIHEEMDFAILIGTNRGANYRLFNNEAEAEEWLVAGAKAKQ
ncbi:MAG: hypothetical protein JO314_04730 [Acidobacteria bacterium]|nr:hypothetical protein [Acidobacteriota bacterium]